VGDRDVSTSKLEGYVVQAHGIKGTEWSTLVEFLSRMSEIDHTPYDRP
jgi:hypothetical protein